MKEGREKRGEEWCKVVCLVFEGKGEESLVP